MSGILKSKTGAWAAFVLVLVLLVVLFPLLEVWWEFIPLFFAFMAVFCHLMAVMIKKLNGIASAKLDMAALVCGILAVCAIIGVYVAFQFAF